MRQFCLDQLALRGCRRSFGVMAQNLPLTARNCQPREEATSWMISVISCSNNSHLFYYNVQSIKSYDLTICNNGDFYWFLTLFCQGYISACYDSFSQSYGGETLLAHSCPNLCVYFYTAWAVRALSRKEFPLELHAFVSVSLSVNAGVMGEYEPKIEVQFPEVVPVAKSSTVKLECFALGK